ncbi:MAG TPA: chorismate lyase [Mariprofundaceae bacterium]|nr:chorismate lyase [Mariprofundaceae bacterium]
MIQELLHNQTWMDVRTWREQYAGSLTPVHVSVLSVVTPLTRLLEGKYGMKIDVHLHDQFVDDMDAVEAKLLRVEANSRGLRRKVSLLSRGEVMFDAESVLPLEMLPVQLMTELEEGKRPLANLLADQGLSLSRSNLSIAQVQDEGFYGGCWARRSVLGATSGAKALVTEVFHDAIWRKIQYLMQR